MKRRQHKLLGSGLLLLACLAVPAFAYKLVNGVRWADGSTTFYTGISGTSVSGTKWSTALEAALQQWSDNTAFKFIANKTYVDPCAGYSRSASGINNPSGNGDAHNSAAFGSTVCGNDFGSKTLAVTYWYTASGSFGFDYLKEADIVFNSKYTWDVYTGNNNPSAVDFSRVALHELGHVLGLDHETSNAAIMAPSIGNLYQLQADDIAGANALYALPTTCPFVDLPINGLTRNSLDSTDCRIQDLYGGSSDTSYVDVYKLKLTKSTRLFIDMKSAQFDPVIVLTDDKLRQLDIFDTTSPACTVHMDKTLAAGTYLILANTYTQPKKCGTNQGSYSLSVSDSLQPVLGDTGSTSGTAAAAALFTGGATTDGGVSYKSVFAATDTIDVSATIDVDPAHVGQAGKVFVLVQLSNGNSFSKIANGDFVPFSGSLTQLSAYKSGPLSAQEAITVAKGLKGAEIGLAGLSVVVYVGYSLDSQPGTIHYGSDPIRFSISP